MTKKYTPQLRADFSRQYGVDLARLVADNRWQAVLDYYHMLPTYSLTREAILNDPEEVEAMAQAGLFDRKPGKKTIPVSEHTPLIDVLLDLLYEQRINNSIASQGKAKVEPPPEVDVPLIKAAQKKAERDEYEELKAFFGG